MSRRLRALAERYDPGARAYRTHWAPVLRRLAAPLFRALPSRPGARLVDLGCGVGVLTETAARAVGTNDVVGVDLSPGMLALAPFERRIVGNIEGLPIGDGSADVVMTTFVLQHVPKPGRVIAEAARVLRPGGVLATATWGDQEGLGATYEELDEVLERFEAGPDPLGAYTGYQRLTSTPGRLERYARAAGFAEVRSWVETPAYPWTVRSFLTYARRCGGAYTRRLGTLPAAKQARALAELERRLEKRTREELSWRPDVVYCVASR